MIVWIFRISKHHCVVRISLALLKMIFGSVLFLRCFSSNLFNWQNLLNHPSLLIEFPRAYVTYGEHESMNVYLTCWKVLYGEDKLMLFIDKMTKLNSVTTVFTLQNLSLYRVNKKNLLIGKLLLKVIRILRVVSLFVFYHIKNKCNHNYLLIFIIIVPSAEKRII